MEQRRSANSDQYKSHNTFAIPQICYGYHYKPFSALENIHVTQLAKITLGHFPLQVRTGEQSPSLHESAVSIVIPCYLEILMKI